MFEPKVFGQSTTASPASFEVTSPPATTSRKVAATATLENRAVQSAGSVTCSTRRPGTTAKPPETSAMTRIDPGTHHRADGATPPPSAEARMPPRISMLRTAAAAPTITPASQPPPVRKPVAHPHNATIASINPSTSQLGAITAGNRQT